MLPAAGTEILPEAMNQFDIINAFKDNHIDIDAFSMYSQN
jgi:hypothetical protein